ncbi:MAG: DNA-processing protein DprA [Alphaproteobacteria bacterium]
MDTRERLDRIRLARTEHVGPVTFLQLLERFGSAGAAIPALPELARRSGGRRIPRIPSADAVEAEAAAIASLGAQQIVWGDASYPTALAAIPDPPPVLTVRGNPALLERTAIAIVGARNASLNGRKIAERLAAELAAADILVVSGFARGIDTAVHRGALADGTAAVMAGGCDVIYPPENDALYAQLCTQGLILSEVPAGEQPQARHFPRRNRIISGLCLGVVVVEAAQRSGSLITARLAGEHGREVFAVPGSPLDPRCRGTNDLIRKGAVLTESAEDVLAEIQGMRRMPLSPPPAAAEIPEVPDTATARERIEALLGPHAIGIDDLIRETGLPAQIVSGVILEMELAGLVDRQHGGRIARLG